MTSTMKPWEATCGWCKKRISVKATGHRAAVKLIRAKGWAVGRDWADCPKHVKKTAR